MKIGRPEIGFIFAIASVAIGATIGLITGSLSPTFFGGIIGLLGQHLIYH